MQWSTDTSRTLGHVIFSPPIVVGAGTKYTQDVAVIAIDASKIEPSRFAGNVIDLGTNYSPEVLTRMMHPNPENSHSFLFPADRLLKLCGTIEEDEMRKPKMYDQNGDVCIIVLKHGRTTGLTVGRATTFVSYTRKCFSDNTAVSKELMILPALFPPKAILGLLSSMARGELFVSSPAVVAPRIPQMLPTSHPYTLSWRLSAATSPSPMPTSSQSSLPRRGDERWSHLVSSPLLLRFLCPLSPSSSATSPLSSPTSAPLTAFVNV
jgi:hypothetical protein